MKNLVKLLLTLVTAVLFASCDNGDLQYMPFQDEEGGNWGMISTDGDVLFSNEFKEEPTVVMHNRFFAKNGDGKWELYSADKKPETIGKNVYDEAGAFIEDVAPVVMKGMPIQFIDKSGKVVFTLGSVNGKAIEECTNFSDGVAVFKAGNYYGCINAAGEVIVQPNYISINPANDGKMTAVDKKYANSKDPKITVLSTSGKVISEISTKKFTNVGQQFYNGALMVEDETSDGTSREGLIDENGEYIVSPTSKIHGICDIQDDEFVYFDGEYYGVMNFKGDVVIRAKYKDLSFANKKGLFWAQEDRDKAGYELINENDETVSKDEYDEVMPFHGSMAAVKENENNWIFVNDKGEDQKVKTDIYNITDEYLGDEVFHSQYFDSNAFVNSLALKEDGFLGLKLTMNAQNLVNTMSKIETANLNTDPTALSYQSSVETPIVINKIDVSLSATFDDYFTSPIESTDEWGYTNITGWNFKNITPNQIELEIKRGGLIIGHMSETTRKLIGIVKSFGKVVKENKNAVVVQVGRQAYFVANSGQSIYVVCGYLDVNNIDISQYADVTEDSDVGYPQAQAPDVDSVAPDTTY